jgi:hypothetical protein
VLSGNVPRPRKVRPSIAPTLEEIVMTAVAHEQDKRFASARDLADALEIYATEAGEVLGARWIARWVHDILGPREVPWIGAPTVIDVGLAAGLPLDLPPHDVTRASSVDGSLVELIEALAREAADEPPPNPTFGPTAPSFSDEIDTKPDRRPPGRSRKTLAAVIAIGLAGGAGATAFVMTRDDAPAPVATPAPGPPAAPAPVADPPVADVPDEPTIAPTIEPTIDDDAIELAPDPIRPKVRVGRTDKKKTDKRDRRDKRDKIDKTKGSAAVTVEESKSPPPASPPAASGSASPTSQKEWDPRIILPTDSASGTKKK